MLAVAGGRAALKGKRAPHRERGPAEHQHRGDGKPPGNGLGNRTTPARAAITGTLSCALAAAMAPSLGSAVYQAAYPSPEAIEPESTASTIPSVSAERWLQRSTLMSSVPGTEASEVAGIVCERVYRAPPRSE